jgi:flavorubredoxin
MGLAIDIIGPSHGVIWRRPEDIALILGAYSRWSRFEAPERVALFYDTMWHSTEKMTMAIEDGVAQEGMECAVLKLAVNPRSELARHVLESRAFLVGSPTLNNGMFPTVGGFDLHQGPAAEEPHRRCVWLLRLGRGWRQGGRC